MPLYHLTSAPLCSIVVHGLIRFILRPCQHDNDNIDGRSQIQVHTDERTQVHSALSTLMSPIQVLTELDVPKLQ